MIKYGFYGKDQAKFILEQVSERNSRKILNEDPEGIPYDKTHTPYDYFEKRRKSLNVSLKMKDVLVVYKIPCPQQIAEKLRFSWCRDVFEEIRRRYGAENVLQGYCYVTDHGYHMNLAFIPEKSGRILAKTVVNQRNVHVLENGINALSLEQYGAAMEDFEGNVLVPVPFVPEKDQQENLQSEWKRSVDALKELHQREMEEKDRHHEEVVQAMYEKFLAEKRESEELLYAKIQELKSRLNETEDKEEPFVLKGYEEIADGVLMHPDCVQYLKNDKRVASRNGQKREISTLDLVAAYCRRKAEEKN